MGTVCARCSDVQKSNGRRLSTVEAPASLHDDGISEADSAGAYSEVASSSSGDDLANAGYRQNVEEALHTAGKTLKRGKTMVMHEAISMAKKYNLESAKISEAEQRLDEHKRQQRREEVEREVGALFSSKASRDIPVCETLLRKANDAGVCAQLSQRLRLHLDELIISRNLEDEELVFAREYLKQSCRELVSAATRGKGRRVVILDLESGSKVSAYLSIDPLLQYFHLSPLVEGEEARVAPIASANAVHAKKDGGVASSPGFAAIGEGDADCAVALRYVSDGALGVWCFVESTSQRRDQFIEALKMLRVACDAA